MFFSCLFHMFQPCLCYRCYSVVFLRRSSFVSFSNVLQLSVSHALPLSLCQIFYNWLCSRCSTIVHFRCSTAVCAIDVQPFSVLQMFSKCGTHLHLHHLTKWICWVMTQCSLEETKFEVWKLINNDIVTKQNNNNIAGLEALDREHWSYAGNCDWQKEHRLLDVEWLVPDQHHPPSELCVCSKFLEVTRTKKSQQHKGLLQR